MIQATAKAARAVGLLVSAWAMALPCAAQVPAQGAVRSARILQVSDPRASFLFTEADAGELRIADPRTGNCYVVTTTVTVPGQVAKVEALAADEYLVGGRTDTGNGVLLFLTQSAPGVYSARATVTTGAADLCGVAYSPSAKKLFVLDAVAAQIRSADYVALGEPPSAFSVVVADRQSVPELAAAGRYSLACTQDGAEPTLALVEWTTSVPRTRSFQVLSKGGIRLLGATPSSRDAVFLDVVSVADGARSVLVRGTSGTAVVVVEMDGSPLGVVVGSGSLDTSGVGSIPLTRPLDMSKAYGCRQASATSPVWMDGSVYPVKRWGQAQDMSLPTGQRILPWGNVGRFSILGNDWFYLSVKAVPRDGVERKQADYDAHLVIGIDGVHSIADTSQGPLLLGAWSGSDQMRILRPDDNGVAIVDVPLPEDEDLAGLVMLAQWVVRASPTTWVYSDVVGFRLRENPGFPMHVLQPSLPFAQKVLRARQWLDKTGLRALSSSSGPSGLLGQLVQ